MGGQAWAEVWHYWDGPISGIFTRGDELFYFDLQWTDDEYRDLYPDKDSLGRIFNVWPIDGDPPSSQELLDGWTPENDPADTITETELNEIPLRKDQGND